MPYDPRSPDFVPRDPPDPCRAEHGASLPPRKRLLAGLKQNGWLSCSSSYAAAWQSTGAPCAGLLDGVNLEIDLDGPKMGEEPPKCESGSVCMSESGEGTIAQVGSNGDEIMDSDKSKNGAKRRKSSSPAATSHGAVERLSEMTRESHNRRQFRKRGKASKPARSSDLASAASRPKNESFSHHERAAAAKLTAAMAAKTAAEARAIAANKAAAAAKAAAVAKAALEAVAIAARNEESISRRNSIRRHTEPQISSEKQNSKETAWKQELQSVSQIPPPVDDEELARELHRAMNSSPRISRSRPCRKEDGPPALSPIERRFQGNYQRGRRRSCSLKDVEKQEVKSAKRILESALSGCVGEDVKSKSMISINDTIPANRSPQKADFSSEKNSGDFALVSPGCKVLADRYFTPRKGKFMQSCKKMGKRSRKKYIDEKLMSPTQCDVGSIIESNPASKNESVFSNNEINFNMNSEDWAAVNPDVVDVERSVNQSVSMVRDGEVGGIRNGNHKISSESSLVTCGNEMQDVYSERDSKDAEKESAVSTEQQLAISPNTSENVKSGKQFYPDRPDLDFPAQELRDAEAALKGKAEASGLSIESGSEQKKSIQKDVKESLTVQDVSKRTFSDNKSKGVSKNMLHSKLVHGEQTWHQGILKGLPKGLSTSKQTFGGSLSLTTFRSAPPVSMRTPAFANGPTGMHQ